MVDILGCTWLEHEFAQADSFLVFYKRRGGKKMMRIVCWLAILLTSVCQVKGQSFQIKVEVKGVRGETGNVLVMAQQKDNDQPVYGWLRLVKDTLL